MVKIQIIGDSGKERFILINPDCIVSVEPIGYNNYNLYLSDGRVYHMTADMFEANFAESEEDEEDDEHRSELSI